MSLKGIKNGKIAKANPVKPSGSPTHVVAGGPGKSFVQQPIAGPTNPGPPPSMRKALSKKG